MQWKKFKRKENRCELTEANMLNRVSIATALIARQKKRIFLYGIVTGDEKWIYYDNLLNVEDHG